MNNITDLIEQVTDRFYAHIYRYFHRQFLLIYPKQFTEVQFHIMNKIYFYSLMNTINRIANIVENCTKRENILTIDHTSSISRKIIINCPENLLYQNLLDISCDAWKVINQTCNQINLWKKKHFSHSRKSFKLRLPGKLKSV